MTIVKNVLEFSGTDLETVRNILGSWQEGLISLTEAFNLMTDINVIVHNFNPITFSVTMIKFREPLEDEEVDEGTEYFSSMPKTIDYRPTSLVTKIAKIRLDFDGITRRIQTAIKDFDLTHNQFPTHATLQENIVALYPDIEVAEYVWENIYQFWSASKTIRAREFFGLETDELDFNTCQDLEKRVYGIMKDAEGDYLRECGLV